MTTASRRGGLVVGALVLLAATGCASSSTPTADPSASPSTTTSPTSTPSATTSTSPSPSPRKKPSAGPAVSIRSIAPTDGQTVGIAMPISVVFGTAVSPALRRQVEKHLTVATSTPVTGAWHWFSSGRRVDFRTQRYWTPGTQVTLDARLGTQTYHRAFTIGDDVRTHVYVKKHQTVVRKNGTVLRTMPSNSGSPALPTWTGRMAVVNKSPTVRMDSCSVGLACKPGSPNYYDLVLPWDVRITWSGTFLHYSSGDPNPGNGNGSHGCVHLSLANAEWFYHLSKPGDLVVVTGSPRGKADADNGYAGFNLTWPQWLAGSASGPVTT